MSGPPIVITGTQRSGTTLLALILDSHPGLRWIDETRFAEEKLPQYLQESAAGPRVVFKLPGHAANLPWLQALPGADVLWCLRDPRDVVASMLDLAIPLSRTMSATWAIHPVGAPREIARARAQLDAEQQAELALELSRYDEIIARPMAQITFPQAILCAALCWRLKNELLHGYGRRGLACRIVRYEELVTGPREVIGPLLAGLGLDWHEDVLRHHELHSGIYVANTDFSRAIDDRSRGRWKTYFRGAEGTVVERVARPLAERLGCWGN